MSRILIGAFLLCFYIGYLVGSSASATAGIVAGSLIGLITAIIPLIAARLRPASDGTSLQIASEQNLGLLLIASAIGLICGTAFGTILRFAFWAVNYPMSMGVPPLG